MKEGKNFSIFLGRSDLAGDVIMANPMIRYFEKLYPNSYKTWHLLNKTSQIAPLLLNENLIDRIKISKYREDYDEEDYELMEKSDIVINTRPSHKMNDWYNYFGCVDESIQMAGIDLKHFYSVLDEQERKPKLNRWFETGLLTEESIGYCKDNSQKKGFPPNIAIKPFCGYFGDFRRGCSVKWWEKMVKFIITNLNLDVYHYGFINEPNLSDHPKYKKFTTLSFFDQIKASLDSKCIVGHDCGFMWTVGSFQHKAIQMICNWLPNHKSNLLALAPVNDNAVTLFSDDTCEQNSHEKVFDSIKVLL